MKNSNSTSRIGSKGTVGVLVLGFVGMIAIMGTYTFNKFNANIEEQLAITEQNLADKQLEIAGTLETEIANANDIINEAPEIESLEEGLDLEEASYGIVTPQLTFTEDSTLMWPIDGGVIMRYSMDQSIYFATLDQYKRNDAMVIGSMVGEEVLNAEYGVVTLIEDTAEYGKTIVVDIGDGYTTIYGQLENIKVSMGNVVEKGQILGSIAEPSRYYTVEGPNLYFQLTKDGVAVDPLEFLE